MIRGAKIFYAAIFCAIFCTSVFAAGRVQTRMTADEMDYDMETGDFSARGNVKIVREGVTLTSEFGEANTKTQKGRLWGNAHAFGKYGGENLDAKCRQFEVDFGPARGCYTMNGDVDATFGSRVLKSKTAKFDGKNFSAVSVTHFEDKNHGTVLSCDALDGDCDAVGVRVAHASGHVRVVQNDKASITKLSCGDLFYSRADGTMTAVGKPKVDAERLDGRTPKRTILESDKMVRSADDSVTATGNARAVQDGRKITSDVLIYNSQTGKIDAKGAPRVKVDLSTLQGSAKKSEIENSKPDASAPENDKRSEGQ